jgi:hypothetical protein
MTAPSFSILVPSCDKFADLWHPFFTLLFRHWEPLPLPVYLISNEKTYADDRVHTLLMGEEESWSHNLLKALKLIPNSHVLLILEDFTFLSKVNTRQMAELFKAMVEKKAGYLRLRAAPPPDVPFSSSLGLGLLSAQASYRTSLQVAFWDKGCLQSLLVPGETPWDFEIKGSGRSRSLSVPFLSLEATAPQPISYFPNGVVRGIWSYDGALSCENQGVSIDRSARWVESPWAQWVRRLPFRRWVSCLLVQPFRRWWASS